MRYVDGADLKRLLREAGPLEPARVIAIGWQVADALDAAHARGLVHRDVKPSNVLIDSQDGREHCYLADFGLTQSATDRGPTDGQLMGTLDYVAPEQIRGDEVDGRADVYALGCLLFEALTGTLPFSGASDVALVFAHLDEEPPRASERREGLPSAVDAVLARAMAKDPVARYDTCRELVGDLQAALGLQTGALSPRRRTGALAGVAVAAVAVIAIAVLLLAGGDSAPAAPTGSVVGIDAASGKVAKHFTLGPHPGPVVAGAGRVWVASLREGVAWQVDPAVGDVQQLRTNGSPRGLAMLGRTVYVLSDSPATFQGAVTPYDAVTTKRGQSLGGVLACYIAAGEGYGLWVSDCPNVSRLVETNGRLAFGPRVRIPDVEPLTNENARGGLIDIDVGLGAVWIIGDANDPRLWKLDPGTARIVASVRLPIVVRHVAVGGDAVWVTDQLGDRVVRVDPSTLRQTDAIGVGRGAGGVAAGAGRIWVANAIDGTVSRIDPASRRVDATIRVGGHPDDLTVADGTVWVSVDGA
jgi:YVTN family beta-propeller protein